MLTDRLITTIGIQELLLNSTKIFSSNLKLLCVIESAISLLVISFLKSHNSVKTKSINLKIKWDLPLPMNSRQSSQENLSYRVS